MHACMGAWWCKTEYAAVIYWSILIIFRSFKNYLFINCWDLTENIFIDQFSKIVFKKYILGIQPKEN